jgi:hypothetical protein
MPRTVKFADERRSIHCGYSSTQLRPMRCQNVSDNGHNSRSAAILATQGPILVRISRLSCRDAGEVRKFTAGNESFGEILLNRIAA